MTRDDIIRMAREAADATGTLIPAEWNEPLLECFAALVAAAELRGMHERIQLLYEQLGEAEKQLDAQYQMGVEAEREWCAKVCDELVLAHPGRADLTADQCAAIIRARGNNA